MDTVYILVKPRVAAYKPCQPSQRSKFGAHTYNSWMILSKLITANRRDAIAAPAIADNVTIRIKDAVFFTASGDNGGRGYASDIVRLAFWWELTRWNCLQDIRQRPRAGFGLLGRDVVEMEDSKLRVNRVAVAILREALRGYKAKFVYWRYITAYVMINLDVSWQILQAQKQRMCKCSQGLHESKLVSTLRQKS